jgi:hypothetical protein
VRRGGMAAAAAEPHGVVQRLVDEVAHEHGAVEGVACGTAGGERGAGGRGQRRGGRSEATPHGILKRQRR